MIIRISLFYLVLLFLSFYTAVLMALPSAEQTLRYGVFACDGIIIAMAVSVLWRSRKFTGVRYLLLFLFFSTLTLFLNLHSVALSTHLNGLRQPLFLLCTLIVIYDIAQSSRWDVFVQTFNAFLIVFALLQIPLSLVQFFKFGASDFVGGTWGYTGGSGNLTLLVFLIAFYFIARSSWYHDPDTVRVRSVLLYSLFLLPCTVNETKISFVFLAVYIVLLTMSRKKLLKSLPILAFGVALLLALNYYYGKTVENPTNLLDPQFLERYLLYDPRENVDVPRFQKLVLMFRFMHGDPIQILFGVGYGVFSGENILGTSSFGRSLWYFQGTRMLLQGVWIQGGLIAVLLLLPPSFWFLRRRSMLASSNMRRFHSFLVFILATTWMYNEALYNRPFLMVAGYMIIWIGLGGMDARASEEVPEEELASFPSATGQGVQ